MPVFIQFPDRESFGRYAGLFSKIAAGLGDKMGQRLISAVTVMVNWSHEGKTLPWSHPMIELACAVCRICMKTMYRGDDLPAPRTVAEVYLQADEPIECPQCPTCGVRATCRAKTTLAASARRKALLEGRN